MRYTSLIDINNLYLRFNRPLSFLPSLPPFPLFSGIVFIDEIDKLCGSSSDAPSSTTTAGGSSSSNKGEGVQRELLTLVEGTYMLPLPPFLPSSLHLSLPPSLANPPHFSPLQKAALSPPATGRSKPTLCSSSPRVLFHNKRISNLLLLLTCCSFPSLTPSPRLLRSHPLRRGENRLYAVYRLGCFSQ